MAGEDRTEEPTSKRLSEARKRGQIPFSKEAAVGLGFLGLFGLFSFGAGRLLEGYEGVLSRGLQSVDQGPDSVSGVMSLVSSFFIQSAPLLLIPALAVGSLGIAASLLQTRFNIAWEAIKPDIKKINPLEGIKRLLGYRGLVEVFKELFKIIVIGAISYFVLWPQKDRLARMIGASAAEILQTVGGICMQLLLMIGLTYMVLAIADYLFQRYSTNRELKMTKEEVKQEMKQQDMSAEMKRAIKQRQMEATRRRMMAQVPEADVVITNPTHYAVALAYQSGEPAPKVIASGVDLVAKDIREKAKEAGVEIVENPPLARSLYSMCKPGDWIPADLYVAVAEVLAFVYRRRERKNVSHTV